MFYSSLCCPPDIAGTAVRAFASGAAEVLAGMDDKALTGAGALAAMSPAALLQLETFLSRSFLFFVSSLSFIVLDSVNPDTH
jgi:hypothetical protein